MVLKTALGLLAPTLWGHVLWGPANAAGAQGQVLVTCSGAGGPALQARLCQHLITALTRPLTPTRFVTTPTQPPTAHTVTLVLTHASDTALIGHLTWSLPGSLAGSLAGSKTGSKIGPKISTGPQVTAGTSDKMLGVREYEMLVKALLKVSDLPL